MHTQCPRCRTTFVVTEEQITARAGLVRCGRCRSVFQAEGTLFEALPPVPTGAQRPREEPTFDNDPAPQVHDEPGSAVRPERGAHRWPWILLDLVLLLALPAQWAYAHRDRLAVEPSLAPYVTRACARLPCALRPPQDLEAIELGHVRVTAHPRFAHALEVRFTLINRAPFSQSDPDVELSLLDAHGHVIARRLFSARDYGRARTLLPPNVAQRAHFGITRPPATTALSYELRLYPRGR
ncbi:MAG: DUF3426 domain-containing protein [Acidiferrobacteraceae bacterium]